MYWLLPSDSWCLAYKALIYFVLIIGYYYYAQIHMEYGELFIYWITRFELSAYAHIFVSLLELVGKTLRIGNFLGMRNKTWFVLLYVNVAFHSVFSYCTPLINIIHKKVKGWPLWGWIHSSCSSKYQFVSLIFNKVFLFEFLHAVRLRHC